MFPLTLLFALPFLLIALLTAYFAWRYSFRYGVVVPALGLTFSVLFTICAVAITQYLERTGIVISNGNQGIGWLLLYAVLAVPLGFFPGAIGGLIHRFMVNNSDATAVSVSPDEWRQL